MTVAMRELRRADSPEKKGSEDILRWVEELSNLKEKVGERPIAASTWGSSAEQRMGVSANNPKIMDQRTVSRLWSVQRASNPERIARVWGVQMGLAVRSALGLPCGQVTSELEGAFLVSRKSPEEIACASALETALDCGTHPLLILPRKAMRARWARGEESVFAKTMEDAAVGLSASRRSPEADPSSGLTNLITCQDEEDDAKVADWFDMIRETGLPLAMSADMLVGLAN